MAVPIPTGVLLATSSSAADLENEIRAVATLASVVLALLALFTMQRVQALRDQSEFGSFGWKTVGATLPDALLFLASAGAVISMAPLCFDAFDFSKIGHREGVLSTMFGLIWLGFVVLALFQLYLIVGRVGPAIRNRRARPKKPRDPDQVKGP